MTGRAIARSDYRGSRTDASVRVPAVLTRPPRGKLASLASPWPEPPRRFHGRLQGGTWQLADGTRGGALDPCRAPPTGPPFIDPLTMGPELQGADGISYELVRLSRRRWVAEYVSTSTPATSADVSSL